MVFVDRAHYMILDCTVTTRRSGLLFNFFVCSFDSKPTKRGYEHWMELNDLKNCVCKRIRDYKFLEERAAQAHMRETANGKKTAEVDARMQERVCVCVCVCVCV